jgi:hypothetical protein
MLCRHDCCIWVNRLVVPSQLGRIVGRGAEGTKSRRIRGCASLPPLAARHEKGNAILVLMQ